MSNLPPPTLARFSITFTREGTVYTWQATDTTVFPGHLVATGEHEDRKRAFTDCMIEVLARYEQILE